MSHSNSIRAILYAFSANAGIALAKIVAAFWTGSGSLLAEAVHSFADCGNQILLLIGMKRSQKKPTDIHPMGFGRETYIWSMMVAITLFSVGGVFSVHEGWQRYQNPQELENAEIALIILSIASVLEYFSLKGALAAMSQERGDRSLWQWFRETHSSELMVVIGEDLAALLGLIIAFVMLGLSLLTGNTDYDAAGSIMIGILLIIVAFLVGKEVHSLLLGETAVNIRNEIQDYLQSQACITNIHNLWAINHGRHVMVAIKAEIKPEMTVLEAVGKINAMEQQIKQRHKRIKWVFFELDNTD